MTGRLKKIISLMFTGSSEQSILYPLLAFAAIILFNLIFTDGFFRIEIKNGHLFGSLIDIFNRGAPVILVTIGMTLTTCTSALSFSGSEAHSDRALSEASELS